MCVCVSLCVEYEEDSEEESGMDWDELEEEARQGMVYKLATLSIVCIN